MKQVVSRDGTQIALERSGSGPPLALVHGTGTDHTYWTPVLPELERRFTVYAVDRRGRGESGEVYPYAIEREFEDVAALVDSIPGQARLFGHSYGALCSVEAALLSTNIHKLVLYEPPVPTTVAVTYPPGALERFTALIEEGRAEDALLMMYEAGETTPEELLCGTTAGDTGHFTSIPYVRRVGDRNEPDPEKWLPGDPFGPVSDRDL